MSRKKSITDDQIRALHAAGHINDWLLKVALLQALGLGHERKRARTHCAKILTRLVKAGKAP